MLWEENEMLKLQNKELERANIILEEEKVQLTREMDIVNWHISLMEAIHAGIVSRDVLQDLLNLKEQIKILK